MKISNSTTYALVAVGYISQNYKQGSVQTQMVSDEEGSWDQDNALGDAAIEVRHRQPRQAQDSHYY